MSRQTPETLLISGIINSGALRQHLSYGIHAGYFDGYRAEYEWLESFIDNYERLPSWEEFTTKWPAFPASMEQDDTKWPASELMRSYSAKRLSRTLLKAGMELRSGNLEDAVALCREVELHAPVSRPPSLLEDHSFIDDYMTDEHRITVPWDTLQGYTLGMGRGELWYAAARPSQGKSWIALNIAAHAALQGHDVVVYSLEMTKRQTQQRMHVILANALGIRLNLNDVRHRRIEPGEYKGIIQELQGSVPGSIHIHTPAEGIVTPAVIGASAGEYDLTLIDYIGLMRPDGNGRAVDDWRNMAAISNQLKEIALQHDTRIIAASQVNRNAGNTSKPPKLVDLSQSDALGQDADVVVTFNRPSVSTMCLSVEKNRHGPAGTKFWSRFDVEYGNIREITRKEAEEIAYDEELVDE